MASRPLINNLPFQIRCADCLETWYVASRNLGLQNYKNDNPRLTLTFLLPDRIFEVWPMILILNVISALEGTL